MAANAYFCGGFPDRKADQGQTAGLSGIAQLGFATPPDAGKRLHIGSVPNNGDRLFPLYRSKTTASGRAAGVYRSILDQV
jgi:hypothetical protein